MDGTTRYHPSRDQLDVTSAVEKSLASLLPLSRVHASPEESAETWSSLAELGVFAIALGEEKGGSGLGAAEEALIAIGLGRRLAAPSVFATMGAARVSPDVRRTAAAYRTNGRIVVVQDSQAELCLVRDGAQAALYDLRNRSSTVIEDKLWLDRLSEVGEPGDPVAELDASDVLRLRLLDAAALAGIADAATEMAVAYAGFREQFGRPIGSFQAVKHHCANMAIAARAARDQVSWAAVAVDDGRSDAALQVECALLAAGTAAIENAGKNIQIHGGIGFSDEADPHMLLKRAQISVAIAGGLEEATARIANIEPVW